MLLHTEKKKRKTFLLNVGRCRDGGAKNHKNKCTIQAKAGDDGMQP